MAAYTDSRSARKEERKLLPVWYRALSLVLTIAAIGVAVFAFLGTSVIVPLAVILVFKFVGANILRVWLNFEERRNPTQGAQA